MDNINVGDILADRDTRRQGRQVKVVWVAADHVTVETVKDQINAKTSAIGNQTDIKRDRLKKGYTLLGSTTDVVAGTVTNTVPTQPQVNVTIKTDASPEEVSKSAAQELMFRLADDSSERVAVVEDGSDELVTDEVSLNAAVELAGYRWLPTEEALQERLDGVLHTLSKKDIVKLVHSTIKENALVN